LGVVLATVVAYQSTCCMVGITGITGTPGSLVLEDSAKAVLFSFRFINGELPQLFLSLWCSPSVIPAEINEKSIRLVSNGDLYLGLDVARDVVIPPSIGGFAQECLERRQHLAENPRHLLASFKGLIRSPCCVMIVHRGYLSRCVVEVAFV